MTPLTEIGECLISTKKRDYLFRPSFAAMTRIGSPEEIIQAFYDIHDDSSEQAAILAVEKASTISTTLSALYRNISGKNDQPLWLAGAISEAGKRKAFMVAVSIIQACCDDDCSELTGEMVPSRARQSAIVWKPGVMPLEKVVMVAQSLITHGVIGKAKVRQLQRNDGKVAKQEFNSIEYINSARTHLGMTREEAERLTMTEFVMLINVKYPPEKGLTREEYDSVMDEDDRKWQEMIDKQGR